MFRLSDINDVAKVLKTSRSQEQMVACLASQYSLPSGTRLFPKKKMKSETVIGMPMARAGLRAR